MSQGQETDGSEEVLDVEDAPDPAFEEEKGLPEAFWEGFHDDERCFKAFLKLFKARMPWRFSPNSCPPRADHWGRIRIT